MQTVETVAFLGRAARRDLFRPARFADLDVAAESEEADGGDKRRQGDNEPKGLGMARTGFGTITGEQEAGVHPDEEFGHEIGQVGQ